MLEGIFSAFESNGLDLTGTTYRPGEKVAKNRNTQFVQTLLKIASLWKELAAKAKAAKAPRLLTKTLKGGKASDLGMRAALQQGALKAPGLIKKVRKVK